MADQATSGAGGPGTSDGRGQRGDRDGRGRRDDRSGGRSAFRGLDADAVVSRHVQRQRSPSAAGFDDGVSRAEMELAATDDGSGTSLQ